MDILTQTRELIRDTNEPLTSIAENAGVSLRYLYKLRSDESKRPEYGSLMRVHEYLVRQSKAA